MKKISILLCFTLIFVLVFTVVSSAAVDWDYYDCFKFDKTLVSEYRPEELDPDTRLLKRIEYLQHDFNKQEE